MTKEDDLLDRVKRIPPGQFKAFMGLPQERRKEILRPIMETLARYPPEEQRHALINALDQQLTGFQGGYQRPDGYHGDNSILDNILSLDSLSTPPVTSNVIPIPPTVDMSQCLSFPHSSFTPLALSDLEKKIREMKDLYDFFKFTLRERVATDARTSHLLSYIDRLEKERTNPNLTRPGYVLPPPPTPTTSMLPILTPVDNSPPPQPLPPSIDVSPLSERSLSSLLANYPTVPFLPTLAREAGLTVLFPEMVLQYSVSEPITIAMGENSLSIFPTSLQTATLSFHNNPRSPAWNLPPNPLPMTTRGTFTQFTKLWGDDHGLSITPDLNASLIAEFPELRSVLPTFKTIRGILAACHSIDFIVNGVMAYSTDQRVTSHQFTKEQLPLEEASSSFNTPFPNNLPLPTFKPNDQRVLRGYILSAEHVFPLYAPILSGSESPSPTYYLAQFNRHAQQHPECIYLNLQQPNGKRQGFLVGPPVPLSEFLSAYATLLSVRSEVHSAIHTYLTDQRIRLALRTGELWHPQQPLSFGFVRAENTYYAAARMSDPHELIDDVTGHHYRFPPVTFGVRISPTARGYECAYPVTLHDYLHPTVMGEKGPHQRICLGGKSANVPHDPFGYVLFEELHGKLNSPKTVYRALLAAKRAFTDNYSRHSAFARDARGVPFDLSHQRFARFRVDAA